VLRTVYLIEHTVEPLVAWLDVRETVALIGVCAFWARAGGARLDAIAGMLGHASVTTTGIYARIVDKIAENPARYLEELMGFS
jgi:integrase